MRFEGAPRPSNNNELPNPVPEIEGVEKELLKKLADVRVEDPAPEIFSEDVHIGEPAADLKETLERLQKDK